ncbi:glycosyltransferase [Pseudomonas sp. CGJS7]|uniref:glycosyltransferase n=1 Tax=Pseudomonas sp. CGJS7 TaxID=3109348 RepID=UPI00300AE843
MSASAIGASVRTVLLYLPQLKVGGAEISMLRLAQGLRAQGAEVAMAVHRADDQALALAGDLELLSLDAERTRAVPGRLAQLLRQRRPQVLVSALTHSNIVAVLAARWARAGTRVVVTEHAPVSSMRQLDRSLRYRATLRLMPWAYRWSDAIVAVSQGVLDDIGPGLIDPGPGGRPRTAVIANPVLRQDWSDLADAPLDDPWFQPGTTPVILSVGRLSPEKNFAGLIRAYAGLRLPMRVHLAIIGEGPQREALQALIDELGLCERVRLLGQQANPYAYMRRSRVFVLASLFEGFGNVLIEAMASGAPVISADCPVGPREVLGGGRFGALVAVDDTAALTAAIERQLQRPNAVAEARAQAHASGFTVERSAAQYLALFDRIAPRV